ncbi:MAG: transporter substrate-binding domain-containing protein [bacterium]|jgi:PAS domain S-box-containing protein
MMSLRGSRSARHPVYLAAVLLSVLLVSLFPGPAVPLDAEPIHLRAIIRQKYPLLFVRGNSSARPEGMAVEVLEAIASKTGISLSWVILPDDADVMEPLRNGKGDLVVDWGDTAYRSNRFDFSKPYITLPVNVYVRKGSNVLKDARRLAGLRVGVVRRNVSDEILSPRTDLRLEAYETIHDALFHLLSGEVDAIAHLGPVLLEEARLAGIEDKVEKVEPAIADSPRCFTVRKGDAAILARLNRGLELLVDSPDYRRILLKWFPSPTPFWTGGRILAVNAGVSFLLLLALGGWHYARLLRMNKALAESRARFQGLVETTNDIVWEIDANATITYVSPNVRQILGYEPGELTGKTAFDILAPEGAARTRKVLEESVEGRKPFTEMENVFVLKSGRHLMTEGSGVPFFGPDGVLLGFRGIHRDVTARKRIEEELRRSEAERLTAHKYEAVGKLAAGMAHNINNLMMIVSGYGSILMKKMDPFDPRRKEIREILYAGDRAAMIAAQLLAFSRQSVLMAKLEPIDALIEGLIPSLRALLGDGIELAVRKESAGATVRVDVRQFKTGIEELARNAKDAMPEGGRLDITTGKRVVTQPAGTDAWSPAPGFYATVSVADSGCGMDKDALSHLFEPFHTTKGFGRGMGLPSLYGFVKQSYGFIEVESKPGHGTTATVGLPITGETPSA